MRPESRRPGATPRAASGAGAAGTCTRDGDRSIGWRHGEGGCGAQAGLRRGVRGRGSVGAGRRAVRRAARRGARWPGTRSATPTTTRRPTRPAGTAAVVPAPRSRSRCSATPAPPATASTGPSRRRAPTWPAGSRPDADRRVHLRAFARVGAQSADLDGQIDRALTDRPRPRGDPGRRQRRDPPGAARRSRCATSRRGVRRLREAGVAGARRHLPRPRHHQADPAPAQAGRPVVVASARRRPGDRDRRGGRRRGLARLDPRARLRGRPGAAVRPGPVPPLRRGLPRAGRGAGAQRARTRSGSARTEPRSAPGRGHDAGRHGRRARGAKTPGTELGDKKGLWVELRRRARLRSVPEAPSEERRVVSDA